MRNEPSLLRDMLKVVVLYVAMVIAVAYLLEWIRG